MRRSSARFLDAVRRDDRGMTLVEVITAMIVFAIIVSGALVGIATTLRISSDNSARSAATNLASAAIDDARVEAQQNIVTMSGQTERPAVNGRAYTVTRTLDWQYTNGTSNRCNAAATGTAAQLLFLQVHIKVTWTGMGSAAPVFQDTALAPTSKINDPSLGTVLVSVQSVTGSGGTAGIVATVSPATDVPNNTAQPLTVQPTTTNGDGCTVAVKVQPGTYTVTLAPSNGQQYRDQDQQASPTKTVVVKEGQSSGASFTYDPAIAVRMNYASNGSGSVLLPSNLTTSFVSTYGTTTTTGAASPQYLSPITGGYTVYAGPYDSNTQLPDGSTNTKSCLSTDPTTWPTASDGRVGKPAVGGIGVSATTANVPMGVATISIAKSDTIITARLAPVSSGDPGCKVPQTLTFSRNATSGSGSTDVQVALPYGSWTITSQRSSTSGAAAVTVRNSGGIILGVLGYVTLDPRVAP